VEKVQGSMSTLAIDGYRERIAGTVDLGVAELIASEPNNPNASLVRKIAAHILLSHEKLSVCDTALVLDRTESQVRYSADYIERRMATYRAFEMRIEQMTETYALRSIRIVSHRELVASAVGLTSSQLVQDVDDGEVVAAQRVAVYLLISRDGLPIVDVTRIMQRNEEWALHMNGWVEREARRNGSFRKYVEKITSAYGRREQCGG
jgi:hypothetical protein